MYVYIYIYMYIAPEGALDSHLQGP
jgi:hypothetical protein